MVKAFKLPVPSILKYKYQKNRFLVGRGKKAKYGNTCFFKNVVLCSMTLFYVRIISMSCQKPLIIFLLYTFRLDIEPVYRLEFDFFIIPFYTVVPVSRWTSRYPGTVFDAV
jgi:hypothetical protein